jgi:hypothetical protein
VLPIIHWRRQNCQFCHENCRRYEKDVKIESNYARQRSWDTTHDAQQFHDKSTTGQHSRKVVFGGVRPRLECGADRGPTGRDMMYVQWPAEFSRDWRNNQRINDESKVE